GVIEVTYPDGTKDTVKVPVEHQVITKVSLK
ncbi:rib/alpha/Esp surface antigen, partial [Enterococcus faecalis EnGen0350]